MKAVKPPKAKEPCPICYGRGLKRNAHGWIFEPCGSCKGKGEI